MDSGSLIQFGNGCVLDSKLISAVGSEVLETIKNALPEEAHSYETYAYIIDTSKELLKEKKIVL